MVYVPLQPYGTSLRAQGLTTEAIIPFEKDTEKTVLKVLQHKRVRQNNQDILLFLVRYKNPGADHDEWLPAVSHRDILHY